MGECQEKASILVAMAYLQVVWVVLVIMTIVFFMCASHYRKYANMGYAGSVTAVLSAIVGAILLSRALG